VDQADAFLQAIADDPDDDAPRLIFADWLQEQDEASRRRAEFIRVQYALRALNPDDPCRVQLEELQRNLLLAHEQEWTALLRELGVTGCQFRRGFVEKIAITPRALAAHGQAIRAAAPICEVQLLPFWGTGAAAIEPTLLRLADADCLEGIRSLDLSQLHLQEPALRSLLYSPRLKRLAGLSIKRNPMSCEVLAAAPFISRLTALSLCGDWQEANPAAADLLGSALLASLTRLELTGSGISAGELEALAGAAPPRLESLSIVRATPAARFPESLGGVRMPCLRRLVLRNNAMASEYVRSLAGLTLLESVEELDLGANRIGDEGVRLLSRSPHLGQLRRMNLNSNRLGSDACRALACADLPRLRSLSLSTNHIGDEGLRALLRGGGLAGLEVLHASYNRITSLGALELADAFPPWLTVLDLSWNPLGDSGVQALAIAEAPRLTALDLGYCELGDASAGALADSPAFAHLRTLNLGTNRIGDAGLAALAGSPRLALLEALNLGNNAIGESGVRVLLASPLLSHLEALHLVGTAISGEQRQQLRKAFRGILG
jgi:uncharacterized protein (TIGR02996 family)